ncbi:MAG: acetolactate decarboxylase [Cyclobacteriaceae bacterium]
MYIRTILISFILIFSIQSYAQHDSRVQYAGSIRETMLEGKLEPAVLLDSIEPMDGLYAIGPLADLRGEILVLNGERFISRVLTEETMSVKVEGGAGAPFLVYSHVDRWRKVNIPENISDLDALNDYLESIAPTLDEPFIFQVKGDVEHAQIHIQKLPLGTKVSSPEEAHQGQFNYSFENDGVVIIGFFSTKHQGIFTHHDSYTHMHLITEDRVMMGHLDEARFKPGSLEFFVAD